jgi:hypothetical protein
MSGPQDPRRKYYRKKYAMSLHKASNLFGGTTLISQLDACKDEAARRLLLGVSKRQQTANSKQQTAKSKQRRERAKAA